jgi:putative ABC transport system permease protein
MISGQSIRQWTHAVAQDLRYGARALQRTPLATGVMVVSIALGIGIATAVFTLADIMLFRPLPYPHAERLVVPYQTYTVRAGARQDTIAWSYARYDVLRRSVQGFEAAGFTSWVDATVRVGIEDRPVRVEALTPSLLTTLGLRPQSGRLFGEDENAADALATVGLISDRLWQTVYGGDPAMIGGTVIVNATPVTVVGIMPKGFTGFAVGADVWLPVRIMARIDPSPRWTERFAMQAGTVIARMPAGLTMASLQKQLAAARPGLNVVVDSLAPPNADRGIGVTPLAEARRHPLVKPILQLMGVAVFSLLLTVCANVASILLARGHARQGEIGVRIAIGASQARVGRQVLTESSLLGLLSLPPGILLGFFCAGGLAALRPALPQSFVLLRGTDLLAGASLAPNLRVLVFSSVVAGLATLFFGIGPAVAASRVNPARLLTASGDTRASAPVRGRQMLVVSQVALATILLVTAGLMTRSLRALLGTDLGFQSAGVVALRLTSLDTTAAARIQRQQLLARLTEVNGVRSVATTGCVPFDLSCLATARVRTVDDADASVRAVDVELHSVSPGYLQTMRIPIDTGRAFVAEDSTVGRTHVVISQSAARRLFGGKSAVGKQIVLEASRGNPMDVIGVVRDVRFRSVEAASSPAIYLLAGEDARAPRFSSTLLVRTTLPPGVAISTITRTIRESTVPMTITETRALSEIVRAVTSTTRFVATLLVGFAIGAALLAGLGIYGVIAYIVTQRTREFGVRLMLGADGRMLLGGIVRYGAGLVLGGAAIGVVVAVGAARLIASLLYGVGSFDAATYAVVITIVVAIGLLSTFIPARRISSIDPADALRT